MPPAANESQGLKIAVAAFVSLTVILAVTSYFLYSNYDRASVQLADANRKAQEADQAARAALEQAEFLKLQAGYRNIEDFEQAKAAMKKDQDEIVNDIRSVAREVNDAIAKSQQAGLSDPKFEELKASIQGLAAAYESDPNKSYKDSLIRLKDLLLNQARLTTSLSLNDLELRKSLESSAQVSAARLNEETKGFEDAKKDLLGEQEAHEKNRGDLNAKVDEYQTRIAQLAAENSNLKAQIEQNQEAFSKQLAQIQSVNQNLLEQAEKKETILDRADGKIMFVDASRNEVRVNLTRSQGIRPQMEFAVFDKNAAGIPSDKVKGTIEIISVGDTDSVARIVKTVTPSDPIRENDQIHSEVWDANNPQQFALLGIIDINRDGKDDRADLIRLIEGAGGVIVYDLPPPQADRIPGERAVSRYYAKNNLGAPPRKGRGVGEITSLVRAYVIDERGPYFIHQKDSYIPTKEDQAFTKELADARREARDNGVRPLPVERLLTYMGYSTFTALPRPKGEPEYQDKAAVKQLLRPRRAPNATPPVEEESEQPQN